MAKVINFGSLNIDHVYDVEHIVCPGETIMSRDYHIYCGGKGANQSIALAHAGVEVMHAGCIGREDGALLLECLEKSGVDISCVARLDMPSGHAMIQVDKAGENAIFLFPGANHALSPEMIDTAISKALTGDVILLQNETNDIAVIMEKAASAGIEMCFNFAPFDRKLASQLPLHLLSLLIVNESEGEGLSGCSNPSSILDVLSQRYPDMTIILTLGDKGVTACCGTERINISACPIQIVDTTSAGDTFIGYFLAAYLSGEKLHCCCAKACAAAAITVSRRGAIDSIPYLYELDEIKN